MKTLTASLIFTFLVFSHIPSACYGQEIFHESFDSLADWSPNQSDYGGSSINCFSTEGCSTAPPGFVGYRLAASYYNGGHGNNTMNIGSMVFRGNSGKSLYFWDEVCDSCGWASDALLDIKLDESGYNDLYISWYMKFQPGFQWSTHETPDHKFLHVASNHGSNPYDFFGEDGEPDAEQQPRFYLNMAGSNAGKGNIAIKTSYMTYKDGFKGAYYNYLLGGGYGGTGPAFSDPGMPGDGNWHQFQVRLKMNSADGAADGIVQIWYDGELVSSTEDVIWAKTVDPSTRQFNYVWFGGNNNNHYIEQATEPEQWYAVDDIVISTTYVKSVPTAYNMTVDPNL